MAAITKASAISSRPATARLVIRSTHTVGAEWDGANPDRLEVCCASRGADARRRAARHAARERAFRRSCRCPVSSRAGIYISRVTSFPHAQAASPPGGARSLRVERRRLRDLRRKREPEHRDA